MVPPVCTFHVFALPYCCDCGSNCSNGWCDRDGVSVHKKKTTKVLAYGVACAVLAHYAVKEIKRRKLRSMANVLGYVVAVAFLIIIITLAQAYNTVAAGALNGIGTHFAVYIPSSKACPHCEYIEVGPFFKDVYTPTFNSSLVETIKRLPGVEDAAPYLMFKLDNLTIGGIVVNSFATETNTVAPDEVVKGRYLEADDLNGVMLDEVFADLMKLDVGDKLTAFGSTFMIVGIVNPSLHR